MSSQRVAFVRHVGDNPTMVLTADNKGRLTCRELFPPNATFEASKDAAGRVTLVRLRPQKAERRLVKPVAYKGLLVAPMEVGELDAEALRRDVEEERDANILG